MNILENPFKSGDRARTDAVDRDDKLATISRLPPDEVCARLVSNPEGLSQAEARLKSIGPNLIVREGKATIPEELWGAPAIR